MVAQCKCEVRNNHREQTSVNNAVIDDKGNGGCVDDSKIKHGAVENKRNDLQQEIKEPVLQNEKIKLEDIQCKGSGKIDKIPYFDECGRVVKRNVNFSEVPPTLPGRQGTLVPKKEGFCFYPESKKEMAKYIPENEMCREGRKVEVIPHATDIYQGEKGTIAMPPNPILHQVDKGVLKNGSHEEEVQFCPYFKKRGEVGGCLPQLTQDENCLCLQQRDFRPEEAVAPLEERNPPYLPQPEDEHPAKKETMGPVGPWATGRVDWGFLSGLTGTRPVVDRYTITRYSDGEWRSYNQKLMKEVEDTYMKAKRIQPNIRKCLESIAERCDRDQLNNTKRLESRWEEVYVSKQDLERAIKTMSEEINLLEDQRQRLRSSLSVLQRPETLSGDCLTLRSTRNDTDLVRDEVEEELVKEVALIGEIRELMNRVLRQIEEQLRNNYVNKQRLEYDWSDKLEVFDIESCNINTRNNSPNLMFYPGSARFVDGQSTPQSWAHYTAENLAILNTEISKSIELRGTLEGMLGSIAKDLRTQADRVDRALEANIARTEQCKTQLQNQLIGVLQSIADTEKLIGDIKKQLRIQDNPMKVAQSRLYNRLFRPRAENCRDCVQYGLIDEVKSIGETVSMLKGKLQLAEDTLKELIKTRGTLEKEILNKQKTLFVDRHRCAEMRLYYPSAAALAGHS